MNKLRRILVIGVMVLSVIAMSGLVVAPVKAAASAGDLIKMDGNAAVYYLGSDSKRYVFPNPAVYFSWYSDFSGVVTVSSTELQSYGLGGNVAVRPGTTLVKITTDPSVYAVEPNGVLRKIQTEAQAASLYGSNWNKRIVDVPDYLFTNYTIGSPLPSGQYPVGSLIKMHSESAVYYFDGTNYRQIANESAFNANWFKWSDILSTTSTITAGGTQVTNAEFTNVAQNGGSGVIITGSGLMASLSATTPATATLPTGAVSVPFTKVNLTAANDGAVTVNSLVVKHSGVGATSELTKVYIYDGETRLTSGRTISASTNEATFSNLGLTVAAGTTKTITITADVSGTGQHALGIASASAVSSTAATVSGSFPITGNFMNLSSTPAGTTDLEFSATTKTVKVGETGVELGKFTVYVGAVEDGQFESVVIYNEDRDIFTNMKLYRGSDLVGTGIKSGQYTTFTLSTPYLIEKGQSAQFTLKGDIVNARATDDNNNLYVRYSTDLKVKGRTYGFYLAPTIAVGTGDSSVSDLTGATPLATDIDVEAGQVTLAFNGPSTSNVSKNTDNVVLMNFNITAANALDVEKVGVILKDSDANDDDDLTNLELVCDGAILNEWADPEDDASGTMTDTSSWSIAAGVTKTCQIRVDIESAKGSDTISADLDVSNWTFKDTATGDTLATSNIIPSSDLVGNDMSVVAASLIVTLAPTPAIQTWVKGSNVDVNGYNFAVGDSENVKVTSIELLGYIDDTAGSFTAGVDNLIYLKDVVTSVELYNGTTKIGSTEVVDNAGVVTFDGLTLDLVKGSNTKLTVKATTSNSAPYGGNDDRVKFALTDMAVEYGNGTNLAEDISAVNGEADITIYQIITDAGTVAVSLDSSSPASNFLIMGTAGAAVATFRFTSTKEDFRIEKLQVFNSDGAGAAAVPTATRLSNLAGVSLTYTNTSGVVETVTGAFDGTGAANFSNLDMKVPKNSYASVVVKVDVNTSDGGATSDGNLNIIGVEDTSNFRAVGLASGVVKTDAGNTTDANGMAVRKTKPTFAYVNGVVGGASTGQEVLRFSITADAGEDLTVDVLNFTESIVAATPPGLAAAAASLYEVGNSTAIASTGAGVDYDFAAGDFVNGVGVVITKGTTKTFYVTTDTSTAENDDRFSLSLSGTGDINWTDGVDASINGTYVSGLPINGASMKY